MEVKELQRLKSGDREAFTMLYHKYSKKVFVIALKFGLTKEDAEEMVQEVFIKIWKNRQNIDPNLSFQAYLSTITKHQVYKTLKAKANDLALKKYALSFRKEPQNNSHTEVEFEDMKKFSQQLIDKLPEKQKQIFLLYTIVGLNSEEIATELSLSKRTVENQIYRANKSLKEDLIKAGILVGMLCLLLDFC
ncbi:RNA polymerase sigma-70 factor [Rapidithrix thailandica]|uniref:RNA polymerase sigma-70 factor n=1 Tax=Rapidithrix thailandica TaxID=413964 RepID=A0AAW9S2B2_9BACT